jgi:hypothetical protein
MTEHTTETGFSPVAIQAMRDWIADCSWADLDPEEIAELTDAEIVSGVRKHYDGGLAEFMRTLNG